MKLLKYLSAFVMLITLLLPLVTPLALKLKQQYVQLEMMEALEQCELTTLTISSKQIQWIKKGKECLIGGEMFDVKNILKNGEELILTGLFDKHEKALKEYISHFSKNQNSHKQHTATVKLFSLSAYINELIEVPEPVSVLVTPFFEIYTQTYHTPVLSILAPPPRC